MQGLLVVGRLLSPGHSRPPAADNTQDGTVVEQSLTHIPEEVVRANLDRLVDT